MTQIITRFRIEGKGGDKTELVEHLSLAVSRVISEIDKVDRVTTDEWECTQDVIAGSPGNYNGRMVLVRREK